MLRPMNNKVLLKMQSQAPKEVAGIILSSQKEATEKGTILALPQNERELQIGDDVLIKTGVGAVVPDGRLVSRDEILGVYGD